VGQSNTGSAGKAKRRKAVPKEGTTTITQLSTAQYDQLDIYAKLKYDLQLKYKLDGTLADLILGAGMVTPLLIVGVGIILATIFLTGWDSSRTIEGFSELWKYWEIPVYVFLGLLVFSFFGLIVYNYRLEVEINTFKFINSIVISTFNGVLSVSFGLMAWGFELTANFYEMFCDLFTSFSEASEAVGKALQVDLFNTNHEATNHIFHVDYEE
jgi:hypothetical protein